MQFLYPNFLYALLLLAIPIIVHLFHFKRVKRVKFSNVKFLKEVKKETSNRRKLRDLLILFSRLLALAALIFAFAQPFKTLNKEKIARSSDVSIFVDNSFSMDALSEDVPLITRAKDYAKEIISAHGDLNRFQIITQDIEGRHQRLYSKEDALNLVDEIESSPASQEFKTIEARQKNVLQKNKKVFVISDFQKSMLEQTEPYDSSVQVNLLPLSSVQHQNLSIDSIWLEAPVAVNNVNNSVFIKVRNWSNEEMETNLSMSIDGERRPIGVRKIAANSSVVDTIPFSNMSGGWQEIQVELNDFPIEFDNIAYAALQIKDVTKVLRIYGTTPNGSLSKVLANRKAFSATSQSVNGIDYSRFNDVDFIILDDIVSVSSGLANALSDFIETGGNVFLAPGKNADIASINQFLGRLRTVRLADKTQTEGAIGSLNYQDFIFQRVFQGRRRNISLPSYTMAFPLKGGSARSIMSNRNGSPAVTRQRFGSGLIFVSQSPLDNSVNDLTKHAEIFVPMLYNMSIAQAQQEPIYRTIGVDNVIEVDNLLGGGSEDIYRLKGTSEIIPGQINQGNKIILDVKNQVRTSGIYDLLNKDSVQMKLAYNYPRRESNLEFVSESDLQEIFGDRAITYDATEQNNLSSSIKEQSQGKTYWKWLIFIALLFLFVEILLIRLWKV